MDYSEKQGLPAILEANAIVLVVSEFSVSTLETPENPAFWLGNFSFFTRYDIIRTILNRNHVLLLSERSDDMGRPRKELDVVQTFRTPKVLTLEQLCRKMDASRSTVLRRLDEHGYHSSYNHAGKFLTIDEVAQFDARELWFWKAARFSKHGSLKETVWHLVEDSQQGMILCVSTS